MKRRLAQRKLPKREKKSYKKIFLLSILLVFAFSIISLLMNRHWNGKSILSIAVSRSDGSASVLVIDPQSQTMTTINIPGDTMVKASHGLGDWKLSSIWKLGINEKLTPDFFRTTIIKSFRLPVEYWGNDDFMSLVDGIPGEKVSALFSRGSSNLGLMDKFQIMWFTLFVKNNSRTQIALDETPYIKKTRLTDGSTGWRISENVPLSLASLFVNHNLENLNVEIIDGGDRSGREMVNDVLDTLGIKVAVITKNENPVDLGKGCTIVTKNNEAGWELSKIFNCTFKNTETNDNFDVQIIIDQKFKEVF